MPINNYWRNHNFDCVDLCWQSGVFAFKCLGVSKFVIAFLPRRKSLHGCSHHMQWFWRPKKENLTLLSTFSPSISHEVMDPDPMILISWMLSFIFIFFWMLSFKASFLTLFSFIVFKRLFNSYSISAIKVISSAYLRLLIFKQNKSIETNSKHWLGLMCVCVCVYVCVCVCSVSSVMSDGLWPHGL